MSKSSIANKGSKVISFLGIVIILIIGFIHLIDAQDSLKDALYKGLLFYANGGATLIAAYGIYRQGSWAWKLGLFIAVCSGCAYVASRTVGLPLIPAEPDAWLEPLGVLSLAAETLFVTVFTVKQVRKY